MRANPNLRGVNDNWNESVKALHLDVDQDKARALGVTSQGIVAGGAHRQRRQQHRPVPRRRQADRHRPAPAGAAEREAITDLANAYVPTASGKSVPLDQIASAALRLGAGRALARGPRLRRHGAGRHRRGPAGRDRDGAARSAVRAAAREDAARLPDRGGRRGGGEQQGPGLDRRRRAADALHHVHPADAAAAQLQPLGAGVPDRRRSASPASPRRCCCSTGRSASSPCSG